MPIPDTTICDDRARPRRPPRRPAPPSLSRCAAQLAPHPAAPAAAPCRLTCWSRATACRAQQALEQLRQHPSLPQHPCRGLTAWLPFSCRLGACRSRCCAESSGHFRLSGRSRDRDRPASESGISNTIVASTSAAAASADAGASAAAAAPAGAGAGASSAAASSDHGMAEPREALPLAAGLVFRADAGAGSGSAV